jgi:hypothetical protein
MYQVATEGRHTYKCTHTRHSIGMASQHHAPVAVPQERNPVSTLQKAG